MNHTHTTRTMSITSAFRASTTLSIGALLLAACAPDTDQHGASTAGTGTVKARVEGTPLTVQDSTIAATFDASGVAEPMQQSTVSTKLMGTVTDVMVREGDVVRAGQAVVQIDARDLAAKANQVAASIADAEAMQAEASTHAARFKALYADSAATRAQYDAAMTGLARAEAGVRAARAAASELEAVSSYATVRAPFAGIVSMRMADPGTFAAPGAPLLTIQDVSSLRISAAVGADAVRALRRGQDVAATIDGEAVSARVEGIVPANAGNLFTVNAIVANRDGRYRAGSSAILSVPVGTQSALLVPHDAIVRDGDLTGVIVRGTERDERRWIRLGAVVGSHVVVISGLRSGEVIVVPTGVALRSGN